MAQPGRLRRLLLWALGLVVGVPIGVVAIALLVVLIGANTGPGRRLIEREAASLTGGIVAIQGLHGSFPNALAIRTLTLRDTQGVYAVLDGVAVDWHPLNLFGLDATVTRASVDQLTLFRKPVANPNATKKPSSASSGSSLPNLGLDIQKLHVGRLVVDRAVAGVPAILAIDGHLQVRGIKPLLTGVSVATLPDSTIALDIQRLDHPGRVTLRTKVTPGRLGLQVRVHDPSGGLVSTVGGEPLLDPLDLSLDLEGPRQAEALHLALAAGHATLDADGTTDLLTRRFDLRAHGQAPAMQPRPGVGWSGLALDANLTGTPQAPVGAGSLVIDNVIAAGGGANRLTVRFSGDTTGPANLHAVLDGLRVPGPDPALLAATPLTLDAVYHDEQPGGPVDLIVTHALAQITGHILTQPALRGSVGVTLPQLGPLAAAAGQALDGHAALRARFSYADRIAVLGLGGTFAVTGGQKQAVGLIGDDGRIGLTASVVPTTKGRDLRLYSLDLHGTGLDLTASGSDLANVLSASFRVQLPDLEAASPALRGTLSANGTAAGPLQDLAARIDAEGAVGTATIPKGDIRLAVDASHLPHAPQGTLTASGTLDRAPLSLAARIDHPAGGGIHVLLSKLDWKSATGHADMTLPAGATLPLGTVDVRMTRLSDLSPLVGEPVAGRLQAAIQTTREAGQPNAMMHIDIGGDLASHAAQVGRLKLAGTILDPTGSPDLDLALLASGIRAHGITGNAHATLRGPQKAMAVAVRGQFDHVAGAPAAIDAGLVVDVPDKHVAISHLRASAKGETVRLLAPAAIGFGQAIAVDHLRAEVSAGVAAPAQAALINLSGTLRPCLDLTASLTNVTPALAKPFAPSLDASGVISARAHLTGTMTRPDGTVHVSAKSMRVLSGPGASLPPAFLDADAKLAGGTARIDARLDAGQQIALALSGTAHTATVGALDLHAGGHVDLAVANAVLGAQGREAKGLLTLNMTVTGTTHAPDLAGNIRLANGQFQDFAEGLRLTDMSALITAHGKTIDLDRFVAHAGPGAINASGTVGAFEPGLPVDLHITAHQARPLSSDLLTATLDMDLTVKGQARSRVDLDGLVTIDKAAINIPSGLPPSVAKLDVIRPGQKPPAPAATTSAAPVIGLGLTLNAPGQIFIRGHGLDANLGGRLTVSGTSKAPDVEGAFNMINGTFSLAGVNLTFTKGRIGFNGAGPTNKIDPSLDFTAQSFVGSTVATLQVGGYASAPKITLFSNPPLPPDQVLALILFNSTTTQLSVAQIASVAGALAQLSGVGGGGPGLLGSVQNGLGLDRLSVGGGTNGSGASVQAGKYIARGVYVGAQQSTSGAGTQAQVQINLTRRLKLNSTVGTGGTVTGTTTPENDPGSSVGLKYEFNY